MRNALFAGFGLILAGVLPAAAADLPVAPEMAYKAPPIELFNWTGFYIGANGGGSFGSADTTVTGLTPAGAVPVTIGSRPDGWLGGGQIGYNWQAGGSPWVFGIETDFQGTSERNIGRCGAPTCVPDATVTAQIPMFGTVRGRIGWDPGHWLFYITGGLAYAKTDLRLNQLGVVSIENDEWRFGWTAGAGVEYAFDIHWSVKAEYLFLDYGTMSFALAASGPLGPAPLGPITSSTRWNDNVFRIGINYRFH